MSADHPVTVGVLTRFQRELFAHLEGLQARNDARFDSVERRLGEMQGQMEALYGRFERLENEYHLITAGMKRIEERLDHLEGTLAKLALRSELEDLKARLGALQEQVHTLEHRLEE